MSDWKSQKLITTERELRACRGVQGPNWTLESNPNEAIQQFVVDLLTPGPDSILPVSRINGLLLSALKAGEKNFKNEINKLSPPQARKMAREVEETLKALREQILNLEKATANAKRNFEVNSVGRSWTPKERKVLSDILSENGKTIRCFQQRQPRLNQILPALRKRGAEPNVQT